MRLKMFQIIVYNSENTIFTTDICIMIRLYLYVSFYNCKCK